MSWLDDLLGKSIKKNGVAIPQRKTLNIVSSSGVDVSDNPATGETDLSITSIAPDPSGNADQLLGVDGEGNYEFGGLTGDVTTVGFAATIANNAVTTAKLNDDAVTLAKMANLTGLSLIGNATNSSANPTAITAIDDKTVLRRSGSQIGFGLLPAQSIEGTTTNDNAFASCLGEYQEFIIARGSAVSISSASNIAALFLTQGDWDVTGFAAYYDGTSAGTFAAWLSSVSGTDPGVSANGANRACAHISLIGSDLTVTIPAQRVSIASAGFYYLGGIAGVSGSPKGYGRISARRVR